MKNDLRRFNLPLLLFPQKRLPIVLFVFYRIYMRKLVIILLLFLIVLFASCKTIGSVTDNISIGMTQSQVIEKCGRPSVSGYDNGREYFVYNNLYEFHPFNPVYVDYIIYFDSNNRVESYGQYGQSKMQPGGGIVIINN